MTIETFLIWIAIGLIAGWLASMVAGGGFGRAAGRAVVDGHPASLEE